MRILAFFIAIFISGNFIAQPLRTDSFEFIDFNSVIKDLDKNGQDSKFYQNLDYESMLFLDKSALKILLKVNPDFLKETGIDTTWFFKVFPNQSYFEFNFESNNLRDFFISKAMLNKTLDQITDNKNRNIDSTIYIKNNQMAIFTIWGHSWTKTYKAALIDRKVSLELLYEIIED